MMKVKHKDFIDAVPIFLCQNPSWMMGLRIYGEEGTQILLNLPATIGPLEKILDRKFYSYIKIANTTKINHIMVSFTDHHNVISIEKLPSKSKDGKYSWYFNNSLLCKPEFSSDFLFQLKTQKINHSLASVSWEHTNSRFKENAAKLIQKIKLQTRN